MSHGGCSHQVCHCGWSKVTTYHGLRVHQGMKGCTPKGQHIPENLQPRYHRPITAQRSVFPPDPPSVPEQPVLQTKPEVAERSLSWVCKRGRPPSRASLMELPAKNVPPADHKRSSVAPVQKQEALPANLTAAVELLNVWLHNQRSGSVTIVQSSPPAGAQTCSPPLAAPEQREQPGRQRELTPPPSPSRGFETPQRAPPPAGDAHPSFLRARRALQFTGDQQVQPVVESPARRSVKAKSKPPQKPQHIKLQVEVLKEIQQREQKLTEVKLSARICKGSLDQELMEINQVFSQVMKVLQDAWTEALHPLEARRQRVKAEAKELMDELQEDIQQLQETLKEMNQQPQTKVPLKASRRNPEDMKLDTGVALGSLRATSASMMSDIQNKVDELSAVELRRIRTFAVDVKLDRDTAHPQLVVSDDLKTVRDGHENPERPKAAGGFDVFASILGLNVIAEGRAYWEVGVGAKSGWDLGVTRRHANRKGELRLSPDSGYWVMVHYEGDKYAAMSAPPTRLCPGARPDRVGVFVDHDEGLVSFYDLTHGRHIHSFTECAFGGAVLPYFSSHLQQEDNAKPLVISPVGKES